MSDTPEPTPGPAESRAAELLRLVGSDVPPVGSRSNADLLARVRAQRAIVGPLRALGGFVAAIAGALAGAVRGERRS